MLPLFLLSLTLTLDCHLIIMFGTNLINAKFTKPQILGMGLGLALLLAVGAYASLKMYRQYRAYQATLPRSDAQHYLQVGNFQRAYDLYIPTTLTAKQPAPLVIALHGVGGNGTLMSQQTGFNAFADRDGMMVVYPDAIGKHWNARPSDRPEAQNDIDFIQALIDDVNQRHPVDRRRIYVTGFSNGGTFTHRVACQVPGIRAIATVAAPIAGVLADQCQPQQPVSVLLIHGTKDEAIPYDNPTKGLLTPPNTLKFWSQHNQCQETAIAKPSGFPNIKLQASAPCRAQSTVQLYTVQNGGHDWAGSTTPTKQPKEFSASNTIWNFFQQTGKN